MADDKDKKAEESEAEGGKKTKPLLPFIMVLIGAILGGAGVVVMMPKPPEVEHGPPPAEIRLYDHPDPFKFAFNPVVERGYKQARIEFLFVYKADKKDVEGEVHADAGGGHGGGHGGGDAEPSVDDLPPVPRAIRINWDRAFSRCLEVLSNQKTETLLDPAGKRRLKRLLIDELSATLFPDGIATVDDILWRDFFVN